MFWFVLDDLMLENDVIDVEYRVSETWASLFGAASCLHERIATFPVTPLSYLQFGFFKFFNHFRG